MGEQIYATYAKWLLSSWKFLRWYIYTDLHIFGLWTCIHNTQYDINKQTSRQARKKITSNYTSVQNTPLPQYFIREFQHFPTLFRIWFFFCSLSANKGAENRISKHLSKHSNSSLWLWQAIFHWNIYTSACSQALAFCTAMAFGDLKIVGKQNETLKQDKNLIQHSFVHSLMLLLLLLLLMLLLLLLMLL